MMNYLIVLFFIGLVFYSEGQPGFLSKCYTFFRSDPVEYSFSGNTKWSNPYAQELFSSVYQQLPALEGKVLSPSETKKYILYFEKLMNHMESSADSDIKHRLDFMNSRWSDAVKTFPLIVSFVNNGQASEYESLDTKTVIELMLSTFSRHTIAYLTHPQIDRLDWERMGKILKSISDFKGKMDIFSLYKIQRAIRQKYSVKEYLNCQ